MNATPARCRHWAEQFRRMRAAGIKVPIAWGHQPDAEPIDPADPKAAKAARQYSLSKFNAGDVDGLDFDPATGDLKFSGDVPGAEIKDGKLLTMTELPDGRKVQCAIGEVSAAIRDWKDGKGRLWKDSIIHVALTPLPVVANQPGFEQLAELSTLTGPAGATYLSERTYLRELGGDMADKKKETEGRPSDMAEGEPAEPGKEQEDNGFGKGTEGRPSDEAEGEPAEPKPEYTPQAEGSPHFAHGLAGLAKHANMHFPPGTTPDNFWERLSILCHQRDQEGEEEEAGAAGAGDGSGGQDQDMGEEEQRPIMMSLSTAKTPAEKKLIQQLQNGRRRDHAATLDRQQKRVDRLVKKGMRPKLATQFMDRIDRARGRVEGYELSLDDEGSPVGKPLDFAVSAIVREIDQAEDLLGGPSPLTTERYLSGATEAERPGPDEPTSAEISARAARVSRVSK